ncbi:MAG: hypothetical protein JNM93_10395 [Bacteriovoracaceae bacterium]|nr:hypothetical protein [Bacteriovoracaceae bacterium]
MEKIEEVRKLIVPKLYEKAYQKCQENIHSDTEDLEEFLEIALTIELKLKKPVNIENFKKLVTLQKISQKQTSIKKIFEATLKESKTNKRHIYELYLNHLRDNGEFNNYLHYLGEYFDYLLKIKNHDQVFVWFEKLEANQVNLKLLEQYFVAIFRSSDEVRLEKAYKLLGKLKITKKELTVFYNNLLAFNHVYINAKAEFDFFHNKISALNNGVSKRDLMELMIVYPDDLEIIKLLKKHFNKVAAIQEYEKKFKRASRYTAEEEVRIPDEIQKPKAHTVNRSKFFNALDFDTTDIHELKNKIESMIMDINLEHEKMSRYILNFLKEMRSTISIEKYIGFLKLNKLVSASTFKELVFIQIENLIDVRKYYDALSAIEEITKTYPMNENEKLGFDYLQAEVYRNLNEKEKAFDLYNKIKKKKTKYRLLDERIRELESNK